MRALRAGVAVAPAVTPAIAFAAMISTPHLQPDQRGVGDAEPDRFNWSARDLSESSGGAAHRGRNTLSFPAFLGRKRTA
jgi:hypothetical protein